MRKISKNEKNNDDIFIKLTVVQLVFCFIAFGTVFLAMKLNSELFESFREEFAILNESDFDLGSYSFFDFGSAREKKENNETTEEPDSEEEADDDTDEDDEAAAKDSNFTPLAAGEQKENEAQSAAGFSAEDDELLCVFSSAYEEDAAVMPVNGKITSPYGERIHPVYGGDNFHSGEDIAASEGTSVYAALDGTVTDVGKGEKSGNYVKILHEGGTETLYCHLRNANVTKGIAVRRGDIIGFVGQTGLATGPHLHFEVKINGEKVDPQILLEGAAVVS